MAEGKPDLQINYDQLHKLAKDARTLKDNLDNDVPGLSTGISGVKNRSEAIGSTKLSSSLIKFHYAWEQPFKDAMDRLGDLAELLDGVATKFFDMDSDFAAKSSSSLANLIVAQWQAKKDEYDLYLETKDKTFTPSPLWDANGQLVQGEAVPLVTWDPPPADPGARPTHVDAQQVWNDLPDKFADGTDKPHVDWDGNPAKTDSVFDENGRLTSQTTKNSSGQGLNYETTTTYEYEGDNEHPSSMSTTLTHGDGAVETVKTSYTYEEIAAADNDPAAHGENGHKTKTVVSSFVSENDYDASGDDNDSTSTTTTTPKRDSSGADTGYTAVSVEGDETTTVEVSNNAGTEDDVKVMTDDDGTVRKWKGNADTDDWEQTEGPSLYEDEDD